MSSRPRAFRLDDPEVAFSPLGEARPPAEAARIFISEEPADAIEAADCVPVLPAPRRLPFGSLLASAVSGLLLLWIGIGFERLLVELFAAAPWLGWVALGLVALAALALVGIIARELRGVFRERRIERLRRDAVAVLAVRDAEGARRLARELAGFSDRPDAATAVTAIDAQIMEADDRLAFAERTLIAAADDEARRAVAAAAKQVSVVTALSPRAIVDVAFVLYAASRLLGRVSRIYGGRPGLIGFLRLARAAFNHLAVTGGVAIGDSLLQQVLGLGLAARVSARLGEGVLNGLMTARFGLAAIEVCRPLPFIRATPPRLADVAGELVTRKPAADG